MDGIGETVALNDNEPHTTQDENQQTSEVVLTAVRTENISSDEHSNTDISKCHYRP